MARVIAQLHGAGDLVDILPAGAAGANESLFYFVGVEEQVIDNVKG